MTHQVILAPSARRDLHRLPEKIATAVLEFMAGPLAENPWRVGKPLVGDKIGRHSARRGNYRIIYAIVDETVQVQVVRVRFRADVYRP